MSETGLSGAYPMSSDPSELRRAITEQARAQERGVATFKAHWERMERLEKNLDRAMAQALDLTIKLTEVRTKMALYSGLGALAGGALVSLAVFAVQALLKK